MGKIKLYTRFKKSSLLSSPDNAQSDYIINTHTLTSENFTYGFVLGPFHSSLYRSKHTASKTAIWLCWLSRKIWHPPVKPTKTKPSFRKLNSPPAKVGMLFCHSPPGQGIMSTNLLPVIAPRMKPSYTHSR